MLTVDRFIIVLADSGGGRGNVLHHVKREEELSGGICPGNISRGDVRIPLHEVTIARHWFTCYDIARTCLLSGVIKSCKL